MHAKHRLGYAECKTGYYTYYQSLLPNENKGINNAFWNMSCVSTRMKRTIFQYHTGTLYNQTYVVRFKRSTSLVCPLPEYQMDSALHILSGCQYPVIRNMVIERHSIASRMILQVVSECSYGSKLLQMDVGSADCLAQHDMHITEQVSNRVVPPCLFDPSIPDQAKCTSSRPDAIL
eukprot:490623-Pelagomonas_calceolata.AAC.1